MFSNSTGAKNTHKFAILYKVDQQKFCVRYPVIMKLSAPRKKETTLNWNTVQRLGT